MNMFEQGKRIKIDELPTFLQNALIENGYELSEEKGIDSDQDEGQSLRLMNYPQGVPIMTSHFLLDGGMGMEIGVDFKHNLKETLSLEYIGVSAELYQKEAEDEKAYIIYSYQEYGSVHSFLVIEI